MDLFVASWASEVCVDSTALCQLAEEKIVHKWPFEMLFNSPCKGARAKSRVAIFIKQELVNFPCNVELDFFGLELDSEFLHKLTHNSK